MKQFEFNKVFNVQEDFLQFLKQNNLNINFEKFKKNLFIKVDYIPR